MNFYQEELERFFAKVDTSGGAGDCQPWDGATTPKGYGMFYLRGQMSSAHRVALMIATQVDGDGLDAGHLCHDRAVERGECEGGNNCQHRRCVNPGHLHWQTRSENLRGRARKTHCPQGHPFAEGNLVPSHLARGWSMCLTCNREHGRASSARRRAKKKGTEG